MGALRGGAAAGFGAVLALAATACGGAGGKAGGPTATTAQDVSADRATAAAAILRLTDFPAGWEQAPHLESRSGPDVNGELADCVGVSRRVLTTSDNPTDVDSPDFGETAGDATVQSSVGFAATVAKAKQAMSVFGRAKLPDCLAAAMQKRLDYSLTHPPTGQTIPTGLSFGELTVSRLSFANSADETAALRVTVPIVVSAGTVNQYMDLVVLRSGRAAATFTLSRADAPFDSALAERLAIAVADRLRGRGPTTTEAPAGKPNGTAQVR